MATVTRRFERLYVEALYADRDAPFVARRQTLVAVVPQESKCARAPLGSYDANLGGRLVPEESAPVSSKESHRGGGSVRKSFGYMTQVRQSKMRPLQVKTPFATYVFKHLSLTKSRLDIKPHVGWSSFCVGVPKAAKSFSTPRACSAASSTPFDIGSRRICRATSNPSITGMPTSILTTWALRSDIGRICVDAVIRGRDLVTFQL